MFTPLGGPFFTFFDLNAMMGKPNTSEIDILCPVPLKDTQMSKIKQNIFCSYVTRPPGVPQIREKTWIFTFFPYFERFWEFLSVLTYLNMKNYPKSKFFLKYDYNSWKKFPIPQGVPPRCITPGGQIPKFLANVGVFFQYPHFWTYRWSWELPFVHVLSGFHKVLPEYP